MIQVPHLIGYRCTISTVLEKQFNNFDVSVSFDLSLAQSRRVMKRGFASLKMQAVFPFFFTYLWASRGHTPGAVRKEGEETSRLSTTLDFHKDDWRSGF